MNVVHFLTFFGRVYTSLQLGVALYLSIKKKLRKQKKASQTCAYNLQTFAYTVET